MIPHLFGIEDIFFVISGLFPKAIEYKSFNRVSNPYECDIGGTMFSHIFVQ